MSPPLNGSSVSSSPDRQDQSKRQQNAADDAAYSEKEHLVSDIGYHGISFIVRQASDQGVYALFIYISLEKVQLLY
jgi:hypothetical protein